MSKDRLERKTYRKSPGRQYGYEYDPLHTQSRGTQSQSGRSQPSAPGQQNVQLAPRPDPRRTRQLLRQNILASKSKTALAGELAIEVEDQQDVTDEAQNDYEELEDTTLYSNRYPRGASPRRTHPLIQHRSMNLDREAEEGEWEELEYPDLNTGEDQLEQLEKRRLHFPQFLTQQPTHRPAPAERRGTVRRYDPVEDDDSEYAVEQERPRARRKAKRKSVTRRRLLLGLGAVVVGGAAASVAAYELPKVPQALNDVGKNIEQQLQDSFNQGFNTGADAVRKEFITALENLEGVSLDAATAAAKLTRVAYDVFVSPLVKFLASVADDFLSVTLRAVTQGRHWLSNIGQDNNTLAGLQSVLETWVAQAQQMPKQIQAIADADLDGAQAYLRALRHKIDAEQAKLNAQKSTPTTTPASRPTAIPKP